MSAQDQSVGVGQMRWSAVPGQVVEQAREGEGASEEGHEKEEFGPDELEHGQVLRGFGKWGNRKNANATKSVAVRLLS